MIIDEKEYTLKSFCDYLIENSKNLFEDVLRTQLKIILLLTDTDDWKEYLIGEGIGGNFKESFKMGDIIKLERKYIDSKGEEKIADYYANYYNDSILILFTAVTEEGIKETLDPIIEKRHGICKMYIYPKNFEMIKDYILTEKINANILSFKAFRKPEIIEGEIRPEITDRIIDYKGRDGKETLKEFRKYYGVIPSRLEFEIENSHFKIEDDGRFLLYTINEETFNLIFDIIELILKEILNIKQISQKIRFNLINKQSGRLQIEMPEINAGKIKLSYKINALIVEDMIQNIPDFSFIDVNIKEGSLSFSMSIIDELKSSVFNISGSEDSITIISKYKPYFDSFMRFYYHFTENIDENSTLSLY